MEFVFTGNYNGLPEFNLDNDISFQGASLPSGETWCLKYVKDKVLKLWMGWAKPCAKN